MAAATDRIPRQWTTRRPTGLPSWPILLIAGAEKAGKTWAAAQASGSEFIGRTLWVGIGEDDPDEYAQIEGADFEIVEHDGSYRDILAAVEWAAAQKSEDGRPALLVVDSMTRLWDLLCDMAQDEATARLRRKKGERTEGDEEADITSDLWNLAKSRHKHVMDAVRSHQGPTVLTSRLEEVTVFVNGQPSRKGEKEWKVKAEKNLPYDVGAIVQLPARGEAWLTGVRSVRHQLPARLKLDEFTVDDLWRKLGLADLPTGERVHADVHRVDPIDAQRVTLLREIRALVGGETPEANQAVGEIATRWRSDHDEPITATKDIAGLQAVRDRIKDDLANEPGEPDEAAAVAALQEQGVLA